MNDDASTDGLAASEEIYVNATGEAERPVRVASARDVAYLYNLVLRRDPESEEVVDSRVGQPLPDLLHAFLEAPEYSLGLIECAQNRNLVARRYAGHAGFRQIVAWGADHLPLESETGQALATAQTWEEIDLILMRDRHVAKRVAAFDDPDVRRAVELRALGAYFKRVPNLPDPKAIPAAGRGDRDSAEPGNSARSLLADARLLSQLGDAFREAGERGEAIRAYSRSLALQPSLAAISSLRELDVDVDVADLDAPLRDPEILIEMSDLFSHLVDNATISGIQRIQLGIISYILAEHQAGRALDCQLVGWVKDDLWRLDAKSLLDVLHLYETPEVEDDAARRRVVEALTKNGELLIPVRGDVLLSTGVIYRRSKLVLSNASLKRAGVRLGACIHDFIPLTHPEYCDRKLTEEFSTTISVALLQYDFAVTVSEHVEREMRRLMAHSGYPEIPIRAVPEPHAVFSRREPWEDQWTPAIAYLDDVDFVLSVGTLSSQKNQALLVQIWQILIREGIEPPVLVLAGRRGHNVNDLMSQLAATHDLDGRVRVLEGLRDDELRTLYRNCLFTMQPSLVEGWGLPIGESLAAGKVCIASDATSIPEVGGEFAVYIDPHDARAAANLVRRLLLDRDQLRRHEEKIRAEFRPRTWEEYVPSLIAAVRDLSDAERPDAPRSRPITMPFSRGVKPFQIEGGWEFGTFLPPSRLVADRMLRQTLLEKGWYPQESWGTWMKGSRGRLGFAIESQTSDRVRVVLQLRAAPWAGSNQFVVRSHCGASATTRLPDSGGYPEFLVWLDCRAQESGRIELSLEILGGLPAPWWGETRQFCVGLVRVLCLPGDAIDATLPPNRLLGSSTPYRLLGASSMTAAMRRRAMLASGWYEPEPGHAETMGARARVVLHTEANPGEKVRVVVQLRARPGHSGETIAESDCGAKTSLDVRAGDPREFSLWLDCAVGADRSVGLTIEVQPLLWRAQGDGRVFPLSFLGAAYGRLDPDNPASRFALAEALLFPDTKEQRETYRKAYENDLRITVAGHLNGTYSLAATNRRLAFALEQARPGTVRVEQIEEGRPVRDLSRTPAAERARIEPLTGREWFEEGPHVEIAQHWPVWVGPHPSDLKLAWVAWEESLVPSDMVDFLNRRFDGILVQTRFVAKALIDSGVNIPVRLMGYAPDLHDYAAVGAARAPAPARPSRAAPFVFLHVSSCFPRKGVDALLAAYCKAFRNGDPVRLIVKGFPNPHNDVPEQIQALRKRDPDMPEIVLINRDLPAHELVELYREASAVVLPTRGEGFNLPAAEALAAGAPLIVTGYSGQVDFAGPDVARQVDFRFAASGSHVNSEGSVWADPDGDDLAVAMREVFMAAQDTAAWSEVAARTERGRRAAASLGDADVWAGRIRKIAIDLLLDGKGNSLRSPTVAWVTSWKVACGIATYSNYLLQRYPDAARDVTVLCDDRTSAEPSGGEGKPAARVAWRLGDPTSAYRIAQDVVAVGADAVVIQYQMGLIAADVLTALLLDQRLAGRQIVLIVHNLQELIDSADWEALRAVFQGLSRLVVHRILDLNLLKGWGLTGNVTLLPHGALRPAIARRPARDLPGSATPILGAYGFIFRDKGFDLLIEAFAAIRRQWPGARLRMVTAEHPNSDSPAEIARCRALAQTLGLSEAIEWRTEYLPDEESLALLNACDLIVLPRRETSESASGSARVAMASRVPVLVTPVRIFDDLGETVIRAAGLGVSELIAAIVAALRDTKLRDRTVDNADRWLEAHDWTRLSERLHGMICGLVNNPSRARPAEGGGEVRN